jgi:hypothetical protein
MNKKMWKLIWFGVPLTKIVYAYIAYTNRKEIDNSFQLLNVLILFIGLITCTISILLSKKIYHKDFYENKLVKALAASQRSPKLDEVFYFYWMLLGLAESAAVFGFVQFILTGNLVVGCILYAFTFIAWAFNYPSEKEEDEQ